MGMEKTNFRDQQFPNGSSLFKTKSQEVIVEKTLFDKESGRVLSTLLTVFANLKFYRQTLR